MITCMKFISLGGQQSEKVVSRCLTPSASSWICTRFQVLRKTWNWLTRDKLSWNRFSSPFFSDSKKTDEFRHAKQVLLVNPISSLIVKWSMSRLTRHKCSSPLFTSFYAPNIKRSQPWWPLRPVLQSILACITGELKHLWPGYLLRPFWLLDHWNMLCRWAPPLVPGPHHSLRKNGALGWPRPTQQFTHPYLPMRVLWFPRIGSNPGPSRALQVFLFAWVTRLILEYHLSDSPLCNKLATSNQHSKVTTEVDSGSLPTDGQALSQVAGGSAWGPHTSRPQRPYPEKWLERWTPELADIR